MKTALKIVLPSLICLVKVFQYSGNLWGIITGAGAGATLIIILHKKTGGLI